MYISVMVMLLPVKSKYDASTYCKSEPLTIATYERADWKKRNIIIFQFLIYINIKKRWNWYNHKMSHLLRDDINQMS